MLSVVLRRALLVAVLCALAPLARADDPPIVVVERTQGEPLRGRLLDLTGRKFRLQLADGSVVEVPERDVREVRFEAPAAPRRPELTFRTVHGAPTARITTEPGGVVVAFEPSQHNEYVMPRVELWRRVGDGPWTKLRELPPGGPGLFEDTPPDPRAAYSYKVVSVGQADEESPVVQRYGLTVPDDQVRKESEVLGPVTPGPRTYVVPVAVFADGAALVVVHAWTGSFEDRTRTWQARAFRVAPGAFVGDAIDGRDFRAAVSLEAARVETKPDGAARLVLRLRRADGRVEEIDDRQTLPDAIEQTATARGIILATKGQPAPRDHQAEVRAALASQRPLTLNFPVDTPLGDVLPLLRDLTGVGVVASPRIDQDEARLQFSVRDVPQAELLELIFETVAVEARPWCGVLWLYPRGACEPWARPSAAGPAGALLERARVDLELSRLPLRDALDLLREQTGLNVVVSAAAQDLIESDSLTATITAHDLSLQDALTLLVDGTDQLHWHARGSVVQVLTRTERPTREVLLDQLQRDIATGNAGLVRAKVAIPSNNGAALDELVRAVLALGEAPGTLTAERLSRALRLEPAANGTWNVVGLAEAPEERAALDAPTASQSWEVTVDRNDPTRFTAVALERREVVPVLDLRALPASDADLWIEPRARLFGALGLELRDSQAAIAVITSSLAELLSKPDEIPWRAQLSFEDLDDHRELLVRTRSGRLFHARTNLGQFNGTSRLRFAPLARTGPSARLREATDKADAGDLAGAIAVVDRALAESPRDLDALLLRAELRIAHRDRAGARRDAEQVLAARPEHPLALTILAYALPEEDHAGRLELCTRALRGDPALVRALVLRADEAAQLGRFDDAQRDVQEARRLAPEDDTVWVTSARVALVVGRLDEAQRMAERAVNLDARDPRARYVLAKVLEARGDQDGALRQLWAALEDARERDPDAAAAIQEDIDALRARQPARTPSQPPRPARSAWVVTIDAAKHGEQALLRLAAQQAVPRNQAFAIADGDLWVDPAGPAIGVVTAIATMTQPGPAIAALTEPDATGTRTLAWTDRLQGASLVEGFRFLVRTSASELFEGRVQRRGEGVLELMFSRP